MNEEQIYALDHNIDIPSPKDHYSHMHNEYEILFFIQGAARYQIENTVYELAPGDLLFIRPRSFHCLVPLAPITYERFILHFTTARLPSYLQGIADEVAEIYSFPIGSLMHQRFEKIAKAQKSGIEAADFSILMDGLLCELLIDMKHRPDTVAHGAVRLNDTMAKIMEEIDKYPYRVGNVQMLIQKYFVSRSWLEHSFQEQLGMTPLQYINKKRVLYAQALIKNGLAPTLAAEYCHYNSYVTFYRNYKKILHRFPEQDYIRGKEKNKDE